MAGGVAVIKVGAATETEMKEKKARVEERTPCHPSSSGRRHCSGRRGGLLEMSAQLKETETGW